MSTAPSVTTGTGAYTTSIAGSTEEIRAAQRLRHRVFAVENGARLRSPLPGHDVDPFDEAADHLIVTSQDGGEVVGTYRLTPPGRTERLYSEAEFDLRALPVDVTSAMVEAGRACVHPDHRSGAVINAMWGGLARYMLLSGHRYLAGCGSVPLGDGGQAAADAWLLGTTRHAAPDGLRVHPHDPWSPRQQLTAAPDHSSLPALLRGYLRLGAWVCGAPAHDRDFGVADFFVLLDMERLNDRYRRYFLGRSR
ncbi:GNAT family N-acetyltransferase [Streptomyces sp. WMMB 322]|uniref:GNAT family N-acetyltransferase n=1 Tax=Streptomyces sp. WMMB 322 TaxID=1286821 RepID=UPI0006E2A2AF|nr:GNAT family N-acyltransferase [Streptomyces sp. WMMB 322]SCK45853.1 ornithine-acyl[acyl carrier protein] N-acyltransferase [Streptomyces sp. WMMB 322]